MNILCKPILTTTQKVHWRGWHDGMIVKKIKTIKNERIGQVQLKNNISKQLCDAANKAKDFWYMRHPIIRPVN